MLSHPPPEMPWQEGIARSRMFVMVWSDCTQYADVQHGKLAYAMALGKPIRLLVLEGNRVPEDVCAGYADFQRARFPRTAHKAVQRQIMAWLEELDG